MVDPSIYMENSADIPGAPWRGVLTTGIYWIPGLKCGIGRQIGILSAFDTI